MLLDQQLQLADERCLAPQLELRVDPLLEDGQPQLLQPLGFVLGPRVEPKVGERIAPPER